VRLVPTQPPGRVTRKARDFEADIVQLRVQGYTLEAIRQALAGAGVKVSISTVRREANRHAAPAPVVAAAGADAPGVSPPSPSHTPATPAAPVRLVSAPGLPEPLRGKEIAEAYMRNRITNPLIRSKERR
jgi:hypothetical protein